MNELYVPLASVLFVSCILISSLVYSRKRHETSITKIFRKSTELLFPYIRRIIYSFALLWALWIYWSSASAIPEAGIALATMMRLFGLTALFLLFITLTPGLVRVYFPRFSLNPLFIHSRRAFGVSVFFFATLHGSIGFFNNLAGNLTSVFFLSDQSQLALLFSTLAFIILSLLAITSFDKATEVLGHDRWKKLHRFVYLAGYLVVFHAFFIGSHYTNPYSFIPLATNFLALSFIFLEVLATLKRFRLSSVKVSTRKVVVRGVLLVFIASFGFYTSVSTFTKQYDPHARHRRGYSKDYEVRVETEPKIVETGIPVQIRLGVFDKRTEKQVQKFQVIQEKLMHIIVIRDDLETYDHIHPELLPDGSFVVTTQFAQEGNYKLYVEYSPPDFYENVSIVEIHTAKGDTRKANLTVGDFTKTFEDRYTVSLQPSGPFAVNETIDFVYTVRYAKTGEPIRDLEPYLSAFGHLAALHEGGEIYSHVHPIDIPLSQDSFGGPTVRFSTFFSKSGKYKLFCQFKHNGKLFVTDFVVEVR